MTLIKTDQGYKQSYSGTGLQEEIQLDISNGYNLRETDWHVAKSIDTGVAYAQEIKDKRTLARQEINEIENATRETINNYSMEF
jgi:hypothetical protein